MMIAPVQEVDAMIEDIGGEVVLEATLEVSFDLILVMNDQPVLIWPLHDRLCDASDALLLLVAANKVILPRRRARR